MQSPSASRHNFSLPSVIFKTRSSPHLPKHLQNSSALYDDWSPHNSPTVSHKRSRRVRMRPSEEDITALPSVPPKPQIPMKSLGPPRTPRKLTKPPTPRKQKPLPKTPEPEEEAKTLVIGAPTDFQRVGGVELLERLEADTPDTPDIGTKTPSTGKATPLVIGTPTDFRRVGGIELLEQLQREANERGKKSAEPKKAKKLIIGYPFNFRHIGGAELLDEKDGLEKWKKEGKHRKERSLGWLTCGML